MLKQLKDWQGRNIDPKTSGGGGDTVSPPVSSLTGKDGAKGYAATLNDGDYIVLTDYPAHNTLGECYQFRADISGTFGTLAIGKGKKHDADTVVFGNGYNSWIEIDATNVYVKNANASKVVTTSTIAHGLSFSVFIAVNIRWDDDKKLYLTIETYNPNNTYTVPTTDKFSTNINQYTTDGVPYWALTASGRVTAQSIGGILTNCHLSATNKHFHSPLWLFGASFDAHDGWQNYVRQLGYTNFLHNGYPGRNSVRCYSDLQKALNYGCPKYLYWTMRGNGTTEELDTYIGLVKEFCDANGVTLILWYMCNSPAQDIQDAYFAKKAVLDKYIAMGVRYVDAAHALSSDPDNPNGWYDKYCSSDGKHPTARGAYALAMQVLLDIPEIMQY